MTGTYATILDRLIAQYQPTPEAKIVRRIVRELAAAGTPIVSVWDGEESTPATKPKEIVALAANLDQLHLYTATGAWVFIVNGNEWDALSDYTVSLEAALARVNTWIESKW